MVMEHRSYMPISSPIHVATLGNLEDEGMQTKSTWRPFMCMTSHVHQSKNILQTNSGNIRCGPHCKAGDICEDVLRAEFHEMFRQFSDHKKRLEPKKTKKNQNPKLKINIDQREMLLNFLFISHPS
ncbi:e3 ubiquitin-protein ligase MYCBP2 [Caerostris extrusa]|uniref:E3 ubiquitin-protein ligase MYCBP2 n=1 Tax=Caerostris extrusa TaxID=172846 RepID=A0AAV4PKK0_CAEEX|nr:e3 ubiquitin-protein ligase MYCBP2 [Caerostris extrusa]